MKCSTSPWCSCAKPTLSDDRQQGAVERPPLSRSGGCSQRQAAARRLTASRRDDAGLATAGPQRLANGCNRHLPGDTHPHILDSSLALGGNADALGRDRIRVAPY